MITQRSCGKLNRHVGNKNRLIWGTFSLAFVCFMIFFCFLLLLVQPQQTNSRTTYTAMDSVMKDTPTPEQALTVLCIGVSPDSKEANCFVLVHYDPASGQIPVMTFPVETMVQNEDTMQTLAEVYRYGGAVFSRNALSATIGIPIDRYVRMDEANFLIAAQTVGNIEFSLQNEMRLGSGPNPIILSAGVHLLDGAMMQSMMAYDRYVGGRLEQCGMVSQLTAAMINQRMDIALSAVVDQVFQKIVNLIETDISYTDYEERKQSAVFLAELAGDPAFVIDVTGQYNGDQTEFTLSDTFSPKLMQTFFHGYNTDM